MKKFCVTFLYCVSLICLYGPAAFAGSGSINQFPKITSLSPNDVFVVEHTNSIPSQGTNFGIKAGDFTNIVSGVVGGIVPTSTVAVATVAGASGNSTNLNGLPPIYYGNAFIATNHLQSFGAFPNGFVYEGIGVSNLFLNYTARPPTSPPFTSAMIGDRIVINYAGPQDQYYSGIISNVFTTTSLGLYTPVTDGLTNFSYAIICTTNSEITNTLAIQAWLNSASNTWDTTLILDPPNYYTTFCGSNASVIGQVYVCRTNFQNVTQNNAMFIVPPITASNPNKYGSRATVEIDGNFPYSLWGYNFDGESFIGFAPNETTLVIDGLGNDQDGTNFIGSSVFDGRNFVNPQNYSANPISTIGIPENDCILKMKNIAVFHSYDSHMVTFNFSGFADGSDLDNCWDIGGDQGSTVQGVSYPWASGYFPSSTNSIGFMPPGNIQGTFCFMNYSGFYGEYAAIGEGQLQGKNITENDCSNFVELVGSPAVNMTLSGINLGGVFNNIHSRIGVQQAPSEFFEQIIDLGCNVMPSGQNINIFSDDYYNFDSVHDCFFQTAGSIEYATNINSSATSKVVWQGWNYNGLQNGVMLVLDDQNGGFNFLNKTVRFNALSPTTLNANTVFFNGNGTVAGYVETGSGEGVFLYQIPGMVPAWEIGVNKNSVIGNGDVVMYAGKQGFGIFGWPAFDMPTNGDLYLGGNLFLSNNIVIDGSVSNALVLTAGAGSFATGSVPFSSTGITNTSFNKNLRVVEFSGTSVFQTNLLTGVNFSLGSPALGSQNLTLQPREALIGTGCTEATNLFW